MNSLKIFVSAYACEPGLGSEIGVGWHWVLEMSKFFELWVLTRESNRHTIEPWIAQHPEYAGIHFLYYDWPKWARFWKKGLRGVRTYYNIWQWCTNSIVKRTMIDNDIKIFHHLTYGNVLWNVSSYGQKQFFIWGPVGGLETIPKSFSQHYDRKSRLLESVRRQIVAMIASNMGFKKRCEKANLILCKTDITRNYIPETYRKKAILFTDVAADIEREPLGEMSLLSQKRDGVTEFISVGRLDAWRGFDLVIEAIAIASKQNPHVHLTIIGDGADKLRLEQLIDKNELGKFVSLAGKVSMDEYKNMMQTTDVVVNASLKEGAVTVSFDSMSMGKPLICLDTTGYTRYFNNDYAILIENTNREEVIKRLADGMLRLTDAELRRQMGRKAQTAAQSFSWENHGKEIRDAFVAAYSASLTK